MNEYFPDGWVNDDTTTTWNPLPPNGTMTFESSFDDHYGGAGSGGTPPATGPCQPFCNHLVQHAAQEYRAGDVQPGVGFRMQTDTIYKYTDHGYVNNIG